MKNKTPKNDAFLQPAVNFMPKTAAAKKILDARAKSLATQKTSLETIDKPITFIRFRLGKKHFFGVLSEQAKEVLDSVQITPLPLAPDFIGGIINYRGNLIPVINLSTLFDIKLTEAVHNWSVIVVQFGTMTVGILTTNIENSITCDENLLDPPLATKIKQDYVYGLYKGTTAILNIRKILAYCQNELKNLTVKKASSSN